MTTTTDFSTGSPISNIPYDILLEIFTHCLSLDRNPLHHLQPDIAIAPILLCHVCSSWRMVALASPTLWARLCYHLTILEDPGTASTTWTIEFDERDLEFIQWWRMKQASVAPFLSLGIMQYVDDDGYYENIGHEMTGDGMDRLLEYITTAQYLELDDFLWSQVLIKIKAGYHVAFPNLHTLLVEPEFGWSYTVVGTQSLVPALTQSALRRVAISYDAVPDLFNAPNHWSTLTHLYVSEMRISLEIWFSILRAVPGVRWAHFAFDNLTDINYTPAKPRTLLHLTTLSVVVNNERPDRPEFPLSILFTGLHLPSLCALTLSSRGAHSWKDRRAIIELYNVLKSAPGITKLALEGDFLSFFICGAPELLHGMEDVGPVWSHAAQLTHLQLEEPRMAFPSTMEAQELVLDRFFYNILSPENIWLDLQNPSCPIRTFAIQSSGHIAGLAMSKIRKNSNKTPEVVFQVTSDSASVIAGKMQIEWGAMN